MDSTAGLSHTGSKGAFEVIARSGLARRGRLTTAHGTVDTPLFMPVATQAAVKGLGPDDVALSGARMVIMNTYHLWLRPGAEVVAGSGGTLHEFSRWPFAIATDSGGYQAYSLSTLCKVSDEGFAFASHLDGRRLLLSPELSVQIQALLGSDIAMQLDVCPPASSTKDELEAAVSRTTRWAERCLRARAPGQTLFGIVQGGPDVALRCRHAEQLGRMEFDGLALGGFSVGESPATMHRVLSEVVPELDTVRPRYLMGVGTPDDIVRAIGTGVDLFDCVLPTRNARNGQAFVRGGRLSIKQARYRHDQRVLEAACRCPACSGGFSRAYLRHLYLAREILGLRLLSIHNLHHYGTLVGDARRAIEQGRYADWAASRLAPDEAANLDLAPL